MKLPFSDTSRVVQC